MVRFLFPQVPGLHKLTVGFFTATAATIQVGMRLRSQVGREAQKGLWPEKLYSGHARVTQLPPGNYAPAVSQVCVNDEPVMTLAPCAVKSTASSLPVEHVSRSMAQWEGGNLEVAA